MARGSARKGKVRFGIAARLMLVFAGLAMLAAAAGACSSWFALQSARLATNLGATVLPTVTTTMTLAQQSAVVAAGAPILASQTDAGALDAENNRLAGLMAEQTEGLSSLRGLVDPAQLDKLIALNSDLGNKVMLLKSFAGQRIDIRSKIQKSVDDALSAYQDLTDVSRPLQEATQTAVDGELAPLKDPQGTADQFHAQVAALDKDFATLRNVMDVQSAANLAFGMLSAGATASEAATNGIKFQYDWAEVYIDKALKRLGGSEDGAKIEKLVKATLAHGAGPGGVFDLHAQEGDLDGKISAMLVDMSSTSTALATQLKDLAKSSEASAQTAVAESQAVTRRTLQVNAAAAAVMIVAALCAGLLYVRRSVMRRLNALATVMAGLAGGDRHVAVDTRGRDEIAAMAAAVQVFKTNLIRNDELAAEAARLAAAEEAARAAAEADRAAAADRQATVVQGLAKGLSALAHGDLTRDVTEPFAPEYEDLRRNFNAALAQLRGTMAEVVGNAGQLRTGTAEIAGAADDLSRRTENQAASLEETAAALGEVTGALRKTAENAAHARDVVGMAKAQVEDTGGVMRDAVAAMGAIETSSGQIGQIIGVVDEIAFQTNLLALNAGVEAARAGEAGRGFAVVASEVRALAQRSAEAAKEIKALVSTSRAEVARGVTLVSRGGDALGQVVAEVAEIATIVGDIARAANEQMLGLDQVNVAVTQMDQVTQQNAAMVEETTAASHHLAREIDALAGLIGRFEVGASAAAGPRAAKAATVAVAPMRRAGGAALARKAEASPADSWEEF